jgi:hypothetical protein
MSAEPRHELSYEHSLQIFDTAIAPTELAVSRPQSKPTVIFVGGQPGAGKTGLQGVIESLNDLPNLVKINGDDFRAYHPSNRQLMIMDDTLAASLTDADVGKWVELAIEHIRVSSANALVEGTLRNPNVTIMSAQSFVSSGYAAELHVMVAHGFHSKLRIFNRYLYQREERGAGRYTLMNAHDASYNVLPQSLAAIIAAGLFGRVVLYTIERDVLFDSRVYDGDVASTVDNLLHYVRDMFHGSLEKLLVDINAAYRKAVALRCRDLVLNDIESLNNSVLSFISMHTK